MCPSIHSQCNWEVGCIHITVLWFQAVTLTLTLSTHTVSNQMDTYMSDPNANPTLNGTCVHVLLDKLGLHRIDRHHTPLSKLLQQIGCDKVTLYTYIVSAYIHVQEGRHHLGTYHDNSYSLVL